MIELKNVTKKYGKSVLDDITYRFDCGKIYVIKGVSGCGKTTFLNILGGIDRNYEGQYFYNNEDVKSKNDKAYDDWRKRIGYVFQKSLLVSGICVKR